MREMKFRGMTVNGIWRYGLLSKSQGYVVQPDKGYYISNEVGSPWAYSVRPETIGQYTGIDEDKIKIYEDDILQCEYGENEVIEFKDGMFICKYRDIPLYKLWLDQEIKIIGNIWENLELIK